MTKLGKFVEFWSKVSPEGLAVADERYAFTYSELDALVKQSATCFTEYGIKPGDLVALNLNSVFNFVFSLTLNSMGVKFIVRQSQKTLPLAVEPDFFISLSHPEWFPENRTIIVNDTLFKDIRKSKESQNLSGFRDGTIPALIWSTSGTTGDEKYIEVSSNVLYEKILEPTITNYFPDEFVLNLLPYGAFWSTRIALQSLIFGKPYITYGFPDERILEVISKYSVKTVMGSPGQLARMLDDVDRYLHEGRKVPPVTTFIVGGESPSVKLIERLRTHFRCRVFNNYGSTEVGGIAHCEIQTGRESLIIRPFVELQIVDDEDRHLPRGIEGRIRVRSNSTPDRYLGDPEGSKEHFQGGFHYSGDRGLLDRHGNLVLSGRGDNIVHIAGSKINPESIEFSLSELPGVLASGVLAWANPDRGVDELAIALEVKDGFEPERLAQELKAGMASLGVVNVFLMPVLPLNPNGKLVRGELARQLASRKPDLRVVTSSSIGG